MYASTATLPPYVAALHQLLLAPRLITLFVVDYFAYAVRPGASARRAACHAAHRTARRRLLHLRRASGCLGTSRDSSSTTSPTPRIRVPRHVARLVMWLVAPLVVDYFAYTVRPGASARRAARHAAHRRLLNLRRASGCFSTSRGSSRGSSRRSSSTTLPTPRIRVPWHVARLVVDYFSYVACPVASARRAARRAGSSSTTRLRRASGASARRVARRRLLRLCGASRCLGTSRGSPSTTLPKPPVWVPRHVARLVTWLVVDYSMRHDFVLRPHWL
jgi:hypothetical protein